MPRPKNKEELLTLGSENFEKILAFINSFDEEQKKSFGIREKFIQLNHQKVIKNCKMIIF